MELSSDGDLEGSRAGKKSILYSYQPIVQDGGQLMTRIRSQEYDSETTDESDSGMHLDEDSECDGFDESVDETEMEEDETYGGIEGEYFDLVPEDVLYYVIFRNLDIVDLLRIDLTCKKWYGLISRAIMEFDLLKTVRPGDCRLSPLLVLLSHGVRCDYENAMVPKHPIRSFIHVQELSLCGITDDTILCHLEALSNLKRLVIAFSKLTSVGIENLSKLRNLTHLSLFHCGYDRTCLTKIAGLKKLPLIELQASKDMPLGIRMALKGLPLTMPQHCIPP